MGWTSWFSSIVACSSMLRQPRLLRLVIRYAGKGLPVRREPMVLTLGDASTYLHVDKTPGDVPEENPDFLATFITHVLKHLAIS